MNNRTYSAYNDTVRLEPLRSCNAYIRHFYNKRDEHIGCELISYCTPVCSVDYIWNCIDVMPSAFCSRTTARQVTWFMEHVGFRYSSAQLKLYLAQGQKTAHSFRVGVNYDLESYIVTPINHLPFEKDDDTYYYSRYEFNNGYYTVTPDIPFGVEYRAARF